MDEVVAMLRAAGDPTRLRLLLLLRQAELTVSELTQILGQSQPRVSHHLKLLGDAGLIDRFKEGNWVFCRAADGPAAASLLAVLGELTEPPGGIVENDRRRLAAVREARADEAAAFFKANACEWERIAALHAPEADVEAALLRVITEQPTDYFLDAGTGTGRMLSLLAPHVGRAVGIDISPEMLAIARDRIARETLAHCQVRLADAYRLPFPRASALRGFDAALHYQVLHYLDDPEAAVIEAARVLKPGGRLVIADFAPHELEFLRTEFAHRRLGFSDQEVESWFAAASLTPRKTEAIAPTAAQRRGGKKLTVKIWVAVAAADVAVREAA